MELLLIQSQEHDKLPIAELNAVLETEGMDVEIEKVHPGILILGNIAEDVFEDYTAEERDKLFGAPPATVWENMQSLEKYPEKLKIITFISKC